MKVATAQAKSHFLKVKFLKISFLTNGHKDPVERRTGAWTACAWRVTRGHEACRCWLPSGSRLIPVSTCSFSPPQAMAFGGGRATRPVPRVPRGGLQPGAAGSPRAWAVTCYLVRKREHLVWKKRIEMEAARRKQKTFKKKKIKILLRIKFVNKETL